MPSKKITPRGIRNCNPCNIRKSTSARYEGEIIPSSDSAFRQFRSMGWGYRAVFVLLDSYRRRGFDTIAKMISRWAPPIENNTEAYINAVCNGALMGRDEKVDTHDRDTMVLIVAAMSKVENGIPADIDEILEGWELYQKHRP